AVRTRAQLQRLCRQPLALSLRHAHAAVGGLRVDRHLDAVRRLERGNLRRAGRGRPARDRARRAALPRRHPRGAAPARRPVVLRRVLRDLATARMSPLAVRVAPMAAPPLVPTAEPNEAARIADFTRTASFETTRPSDI